MFYQNIACVQKKDKFQIFFTADECIWCLSGNSLEEIKNQKYHLSKHIYHHGPVRTLKISEDGKWLAFAGSLENAFDVYVVSTDGGNPHRCTFLNNTMISVIKWEGDKVIFSSDHESPGRFRIDSIFETKVNLEAGQNESIVSESVDYDGKACGNARRLDYGESGWMDKNSSHTVLHQDGYGYLTWNKYQGGANGKLFLKTGNMNGDMNGNSSFERIAESNFNCLYPVLKNDSVFYLSDEVCEENKNGVGNVFEYNIESKKKSVVTRSDDYYISDFTILENILFFAKAGDIYYKDLNSNKNEEKLEINLKAHFPQTEKRIGYVNDHYKLDHIQSLNAFDINDDGSKILALLRGYAFEASRYVFNAQEVGEFAYSHLAYLGKEKIVGVKAGKEEYIQVLNKNREVEKEIKYDLGHVFSLQASPCGNKFAVLNNRCQIIVFDLEKDEQKVVKERSYWQYTDMSWSPDGRYLAFNDRVSKNSDKTKAIFVADTHNKYEVKQITSMENNDYNPVFDPNGKYLYFLSNRSMNNRNDCVRLEIDFVDTIKPYAIALSENEEGFVDNPFRKWTEQLKQEESEKEEEEKDKEKDQDQDEEKKEEDKKVKCEIDFENIFDRCYPFPVPTGDYQYLIAGSDELFFMKSARGGGKKPGYIVEKFCFESLKAEVVLQGVLGFELSGDKKTAIYVNEESMKVAPVSKLDGEDGPSWKAGGVIDWERFRVTIDQSKEFKIIFGQAWLYIKENFSNKQRTEIDWDELYAKYVSLLDKVVCRHDLNKVMSAMQSELETSHSFVVSSGDIREIDDHAQGFLGGRLKYVDGKYEICEIYQGRSWSAGNAEKSALSELKVGDKIISIGGVKLSKTFAPHNALVDSANKVLEVEIERNEKVIKRYVYPNSNEKEINYIKWVNDNKKAVEEFSERIGYVHIPNMLNDGFSQFCRDYYSQYKKEVLIIDARYNSGGYTSPMVLDVLSRKRFGFDCTPNGSSPDPYETSSGKYVFLANESTGSDGDIFTYKVKKLRLGKVVGTRTWGGVIGMWVRFQFIDGGMMSQPEYCPDACGDEIIENYGVDPDIEIRNSVEDQNAKKDNQLLKALELAKNMM